MKKHLKEEKLRKEEEKQQKYKQRKEKERTTTIKAINHNEQEIIDLSKFDNKRKNIKEILSNCV